MRGDGNLLWWHRLFCKRLGLLSADLRSHIAAFKGDSSKSLLERMRDGYVDAIQAIDSGAATALLAKWVTVSPRLAK